MIEKKLEELKNKIKNKNLDFNEDEKIILQLHQELVKDIIIILAEDLNAWSKGIADILIDDSILTNIPENVKDQFWINYIKYAMKFEQQSVGYAEVSEILSIINVSKKTEEQILELVSENTKEDLNITVNDLEIQNALDQRRYDLIAKIDRDLFYSEELSTEVAIRLINEFPYDKYESPKFFAGFPKLLENIIDKLSIKTIIEIINIQEFKSPGKTYQLPNEVLKEQLINKLKYAKLEEIGYYDYDLNFVNNLLSKKQLDEIAEITVNNNSLNYIDIYYRNNPDKVDFCCNKIIDYMKITNNKNFFDSLSEIISANEILVDAAIENGFIEGLISNNILEKYPNKIQNILENIENKNPRYKNCKILDLPYNIEYYHEILEGLVNNGFTEEIILYNISFINSKIVNILLNITKNNPNVEIKGFNYINNVNGLENIAIELLKQKKYKKALEILGNMTCEKMLSDILKIDEEIILSSIEESLYFSSELIKKVPTELFQNQNILEIYFKEPFLSNQLINYLNHHEELDHMYNHETFLIAKKSLAANLKVDIERLSRFEEKFGAKIIRYINNENILKILNLSDEDFEKFLELFPDTQYTMTDLESAYDSLKQYEFSKTHPEVINIFPTILHAIEDNNNEIIFNSINEIYSCLDSPFFKIANEKYQFPEGYDESNPKLFVTFIIEKIKNSEGEKKEKYITILHDITDYYISRKRGLYRETYDMIGDLKLPYILDPKSIDREYLKYLIENSMLYTVNYTVDKDGKIKNEYLMLSDYLIRKLESYGLEHDFANALVRYNNVIAKNTYGYSEDLLKSNYKYLIKAINEIAKDKPKHSFFNPRTKYDVVEQLDNSSKIKRHYEPGPSGVDIYDILTSLRIEVLQECVLGNEEVYESLKTLMTKKKIHMLPESLTNILSNTGINISSDLTNIAAFISYYSQIYAKEKSTLASNNRPTDNINMTLTNILINAEVYSGISTVYSQILGNEDAKLIKANPGPNSATQKIANDGRLKEAIALTEKLYRRQTVTIPTFNECVKLSDDKSMRVVVGNFTNPCNLTHGERTGACMRIGGVGDTLFNFAINNPNGFHIRFEDPDTGKYISRVTGFRNGNTVFLNELRNSCDPSLYTDEQVIEACKIAAEMLIELSKDSTCPIENVVVHRAYATTGMEEKNVQLNVRNIKEGLPAFYTDVNSNTIVLATTAKTGKFTLVNLDKTKVPEYPPAREIPKVYKESTKATGKITRVASIKKLLNGENYEYISPIEFENGLIYAIVSEDWYIYVDELGQIHQDCIDIDPRAKEELAEYMIKLETQLATEPIKKEETYGY